MKWLTLVCVLSCVQVLRAQTISGHITDAVDGKSLAGVTVYIGNSSRSTTSDKEGNFKLEGFPNSSYELLFSLVGYELYSISSGKLDAKPLAISLRPKDNALDPVIVQGYEKDGWNKWGRMFLDNFIGTLPFSPECTIKNQKDIRFIFHKKQNILEAVALEPLVISNKYLGYDIRYDLVTFQYDISQRYIFYAGYPVFKDLTEGKGAHFRNVRLKRRAEVYEGSMMHFMRALYRNMLEQEGFQVRRLERKPNLEKERVDSLYNAHFSFRSQPDGSRRYENNIAETYPRDSVQYFKAVRMQPKVLQVLHPKWLTANDLYFRHDTLGGVVLGFENYLYITYPRKLELPQYYMNKIGVNGDSCITAILSLNNISQFILYANGQYYPPSNIMAEAYWGWSEKISSMLPFDYKRPENEEN